MLKSFLGSLRPCSIRPLLSPFARRVPAATVRIPLLILLAVGLPLGCATPPRVVHQPACRLAEGETLEDCPWAELARELLTSQNFTPDSGTALLTQRIPQFVASLRSDSTRSDLASLWGRALNFDEVVKQPIVDPKWLSVLSAEMKIPVESPSVLSKRVQRVHSGLQHIYGYLFSTLQTPYGYKRKRWVSDVLSRGMGLPPGTLGTGPLKGTPYLNLSYFLGRIALPDSPPILALQSEDGRTSALPQELRNFPFSTLKRSQLREECRDVIFYTDIIEFRFPQEQSHLLIYSVQEKPQTQSGSLFPRLITAFPVDQKFVDRIKTEARSPSAKSSVNSVRKQARPRYNAAFEQSEFDPILSKGCPARVTWEETLPVR